MKYKDCSQCGCSRKTIIKAILKDQETNVMIESTWLCIPCFLETIKIDLKYSDKKRWTEFMEVAK